MIRERLLNRQCEILSQLFQFASLLGCELIRTKLYLDFLKLTRELEWHLRIVVVNHWRSGVLADVEAFIEGKFADGRGMLDTTFGHFLAVDRKSPKSAFAKTTAVVFEVENNRVPARREFLSAGNAGFVGVLFWIFRAVLVCV